MFRKLRLKFIVVALCSVFTVIFSIVCGINIVNRVKMNEEADNIVRMLIAGNGEFSGGPPFMQNPELPFETRYFTVEFDAQGRIVAVNTEKIAAVEEETARSYAADLYDSGKTNGYYGNYRYGTGQTPFGGVRYVFVDCTRVLSNFINVLWISIAVGAGGLLVIFILIFLLFGKIMKPVAESYKKQKQFIMDAGHELKTPLTIIGADAEVMEMQYGKNEWTDDIKAEVNRLSSLIAKLIMLAKMDESGQKVVMTDFSLSDAVEESVKGFSAVAFAKGNGLVSDIAPNISYCGNEELIRQLVDILIDNAIKYSDEGGNIEVSLKELSNKKHITVKNKNAAFSEKDAEKIFDRFYRCDSSRSQKSGYGIGLSLAKSIAEVHRGKISVKKCGDQVAFIVIL